MATVKGANVTKYDAGGSGDNIVADGFIKTVEKVWIDSYSVTAAIPTTTSILIARLPKGRKLVGVDVFLPILSAAGTTSTVYIGPNETTSLTPTYGTMLPTVVATATISTVSMSVTGIGQEMSADNTGIYIMINPATTITGGTIRSIVRYT